MDLKTFADTFLQLRRFIAVLVVVVSLVAVWGNTRVGFDDNPRDVFRSDDAEFQLMEEVFEQFGADENTCYLIVAADDLFSRAALVELRTLVDRVQALPSWDRVISLFDERFVVLQPLPHRLLPNPDTATPAQLEQARLDAKQHPLVGGQLLSDDLSHCLIAVRIRGEELSVRELQPAVAQLWELAEDANAGDVLDVHVTGIPAIRVDGFAIVKSESVRYTLLGAVAAISMAIVLMRRVATIVVVCASALTGALWTVGSLGLVQENITVLTTVLPMLAMIVGFTDSVHLASDIAQARAQGIAPRQATHGALRHLTIACLLTSLTTAIGFASLTVTGTSIIRRFGLACAAGAILTFCSVITVLPLLSSTRIGRWILPPQRPGWLQTVTERVARGTIGWTLRHRIAITCTAIIATGLMIPIVTQLSPENEISENMPTNARSLAALNLVDNSFGGILPLYVCIDWPEDITLTSPQLTDAIRDVSDLCRAHADISLPISLLDVQSAAGNLPLTLLPPDVIREFAIPERNRTVVMARSPDLGSRRLASTFTELNDQLQRLQDRYPGFQFRLTGSAVMASRNLGQMISDLASSLSLATAVIFLTITLACRSLRLGLICLIPNAIPLLLTATTLVWIDGSLRFSGVIVFSVCLGIAVDDTIHLLMRFRRELQHTKSVDQAITNSVKAVGSALVTTTLVLIVGLSIPLTSDVPGNRMFAGLSCIAIAAALVADLIVLPAMLACFVHEPE